MIDYNISEVAVSYASLCGVLAGFAFAALTFVITRQIPLQNYQNNNHFLEKFTEIMTISFFGLVTASVLQTIRGGLQPDTETETIFALSITYIVSIEMSVSILLMLAGLIMMTIQYVSLSTKAKERVKVFSVISFIVTLLFIWMTAIDFWVTIPGLQSLNTTLKSVGISFPLITSLIIFIFTSRQKFISFDLFSLSIRISITIPCVIMVILWVMRGYPSFVQEYYMFSYFLTSFILLTIPLIGGWIQIHCVEEVK